MEECVAEVVGYCSKNIDEGEVLCQGLMGPVYTIHWIWKLDMIQKKHPPSLLKPKNRGIT